MKTTIKEVRNAVRTALLEGPRTRIGYISANIKGDTHYTDTLTVYVEPDGKVSVTVTMGSPVGGMDYDSGGQTHNDVEYQASTKANPKPADVIALVKKPLMNDKFNFRQYGKPTKNFTWVGAGHGVSAALVAKALAATKAASQPAPEPAEPAAVSADEGPWVQEWDGWSPAERKRFLEQETGFEPADVAELSKLTWSKMVQQIGPDVAEELTSTLMYNYT